MLHQLFSLMCVWCVIKVGGGGGGAPTSLDVNGLKRVACGFKEAGIATKKEMDEQLVSYVTFVMWFFTEDRKMGGFFGNTCATIPPTPEKEACA